MSNTAEKVIIWGAESNTASFLNAKVFYADMLEIVAVTDGDEKKWGTTIAGHVIVSPQQAYEMEFDKIVITSDTCYEEIEKRITNDTGVTPDVFENRYYVAKLKLMERYKNSDDAEIQEILSYLKTHRLGVFNAPFKFKYRAQQAKIARDEENGLYYVMHHGRRLYMARSYNSEARVRSYYKGLCTEQDKDSPHLYLEGDFDVEQGDVVVDVGVAEGNFALDVIDKVSRIYLVETDEEWIEALQYTFADYKDKVVYCNKFAADYTAYNTATLDAMIPENVNFIKMDIEGCESAGLLGARGLIAKSPKVKCAICLYHNDSDEAQLTAIAESYGMKCSYSKGYEWFPWSDRQLYILPTFRRGMLRCVREE